MQGKKWIAGFACAFAMLAVTASASAARSVYPQDQGAISLRGGPAGWTGTTSSEGLCVPVLLCPSVTNTTPSSGGPGNSGYLRTEIGSLTGVGATSIGSFTGPAFKYRGAGGAIPDAVSLRLSRRADVAALLDVAGNQATYTVRLRNLAGGPNVELVNDADLDGSPQWSEVPAVSIDPGQLQVGNRYRLQIVSRFESGVEVVPGSSTDYAKVRLIARDRSAGPGGNGPGGNGSNGGNGNGADLAGGIIGGTVAVKGKHLSFRVRCAKRAPRRCHSRLQGRLSRKGARITGTKAVRIRPGARKTVRLKIRSSYREQVAHRKRIAIKRKTKVAGKRRTTYRTARVRG